MNLQIATKHRDKFFSLIDSAKQTITVRPPAARTSSTNITHKIFGSTTEEAYGTSVEVDGWVHQGRVPSNFTYGQSNDESTLVGMVSNSDLVILLKLSDCLEDATKVYGRTIFDSAKDVQVSGSTFEVTGTFRSGLAPLGPYLLWVGLVNSGE